MSDELNQNEAELDNIESVNYYKATTCDAALPLHHIGHVDR